LLLDSGLARRRLCAWYFLVVWWSEWSERARGENVILRGLFIIGFGSHAHSVADVALDIGIPALTFVDAAARPEEQFAGFPVVTTISDALPDGWSIFAAAGDNLQRQRQIETTIEQNRPLASLVSKRAYVGLGATIQPGTFVAHNAHIGPMAAVGRGVIVNTAAVVEHDCIIGDFTHISVNATVAGRSRIGRLVFVGAGATVIDGVRITDGVTVGAGSTVIDDIVEPGVHVGSPARRIERQE
jgi:UDP-N-acetylbacillosamine N-acetyltransferase